MIHLLSLTAFTILRSLFNKKVIVLITAWIGMSVCQNTYAQSSFSLFGSPGNRNNSEFRLNSIEGNSLNYSSAKDWELSAVFGGRISGESSGSIYILSLAKRLNSHYFYIRYTPGYQQEFVFNTGTSVTISDTTEAKTTLKTKLSYKEKFGFGYSFNLNSSISAGLSIRYFDQQFTLEEPVFEDSANTILVSAENNSRNYWRGDIGLNYRPIDNLSFQLSSINLFSLKENTGTESIFEMSNEKGALIGISYSPENIINLFANFETTGGFTGGANFNFDLLGGNVTVGTSIFHDNNFKESIAGIIPVINYSTELFSATLSGVKYFSAGSDNLLSSFLDKKIDNIVNNQYSSDRLFLAINFALSFKKEKSVKLLDVEIKKEIFPTLGDEYINEPFAVGRITNISDNSVLVRPSSYIAGINEEEVSSPSIKIFPGDTVNVPFYTIVGANNPKINKREISQASFYVKVLNGEPEDEIQKPVLINNANSWDGRVKNLRFFVTKDLVFANKYAKNVLNEEKEKLSGLHEEVSTFAKVKILFNKFVKEMIYVSDPRSSVEYVQFPNETLNVKGGDCDDLSVGFASILESIGIETAFVDYKSESGISHVNLLVNTGMPPDLSKLITVNDKKYFVREDSDGHDKIWIPIEMTSLTDFENAWSLGAEKFYGDAIENLGLAKSHVEIIDIN